MQIAVFILLWCLFGHLCQLLVFKSIFGKSVRFSFWEITTSLIISIAWPVNFMVVFVLNSFRKGKKP